MFKFSAQSISQLSQCNFYFAKLLCVKTSIDYVLRYNSSLSLMFDCPDISSINNGYTLWQNLDQVLDNHLGYLTTCTSTRDPHHLAHWAVLATSGTVVSTPWNMKIKCLNKQQRVHEYLRIHDSLTIHEYLRVHESLRIHESLENSWISESAWISENTVTGLGWTLSRTQILNILTLKRVHCCVKMHPFCDFDVANFINYNY